MYSPTTRLLTVLELLQSHRQISGAELAQRLEVDTRTVRRYITTLQDMGIPVEAERGPQGAYHLERGHRMPPMLFTDQEAVALTLGLMAIRDLGFPVALAAVEGALAKVERVLPAQVLGQVRGLQEAIQFNDESFGEPIPRVMDSDVLPLLSSAVHQRQRVHLGYKAFNGEVTERDYDPYGVVYTEGFWYTAGCCHLRSDIRTFRLDRITRLEMHDARFEPPYDFDTLAHVLASLDKIYQQRNSAG